MSETHFRAARMIRRLGAAAWNLIVTFFVIWLLYYAVLALFAFTAMLGGATGIV